MKAAIIGLIILMFNVMLAGVAHADIFTTTIYYESSYLDDYDTGLPSNISTINEAQQYSQTMGIMGIIFNSLSWNWIYEFIPVSLHADASWLVSGLNIISLAIISIAFVELFMKRNII